VRNESAARLGGLVLCYFGRRAPDFSSDCLCRLDFVPQPLILIIAPLIDKYEPCAELHLCRIHFLIIRRNGFDIYAKIMRKAFLRPIITILNPTPLSLQFFLPSRPPSLHASPP
jgi:hypothetical protein